MMLQYPQILAELCTQLAPFQQGSVEITEDTDLLADLDLDSLKVMNLLLLVEDRFDISIPVSILPDVRTVKDLALQIEGLARQG
jgi:acyl carrier protein